MTTWCDGPAVSAICPLPAAAGDGAGGGFAGLAAAMASAFGQLLQALLGFWSAPDAVGALDAPGGLVGTLSQYTSTLVAATATAGVMIAGTRLVVASSRAQQPARDLVRGLLVLVVVAGGGAAVVQAVRFGLDGAADDLLSRGFDGRSIGSQLVALTDLQRTGISPGVTFLLGLLGSLSTFAQFFVMVVRGPVLAVLVGLLPIAAATAMTGTGLTYVRRLLAWIGALTLYKFVAGLLYAAAFLAARGPDGGSPDGAVSGSGRLTGVVTGIALITVGVGALPALVRLLAPAVEAAVAVGSSGDAVVSASSGAVTLSGRGRQGEATGPPSDAGAQTRPGLVRPAGAQPTGTAAAGTGRRRADADDQPPGGGPAPAPERHPEGRHLTATDTATDVGASGPASGPGTAGGETAGAGAGGAGGRETR